MRFRVKVHDAETGEPRVVEVEADSKEEALRLAKRQVEAEQEPEAEQEEEEQGKKCNQCGAPVGYLLGLVSDLCGQCRQVDLAKKRAERAEAARQRAVAEAEAEQRRLAAQADSLRQAEEQKAQAARALRQARTVGPRR